MEKLLSAGNIGSEFIVEKHIYVLMSGKDINAGRGGLVGIRRP
jgi:hypothetical protein